MPGDCGRGYPPPRVMTTAPACPPCCRAARGARCERCAATVAHARCCATRARSRWLTCRKPRWISTHRKTSARGAVDPAGLAAGVVFFLPDRHASFGLVDDVAARVESRAAMPGRYADPHRTVADRELAYAVLADRGFNCEPLLRFGQDLRALFLCYTCVRFVFEGLHRLALVVVADPPFEGHARAGNALHELALARFGVDRRRRDLERHARGSAARDGREEQHLVTGLERHVP